MSDPAVTDRPPAAPRPTSRGDGGGSSREAADSRVRFVLSLNAAFTVLSALLLITAAEPMDDLLDTGHPGWIRVIGVALGVFAVDVLVVASADSIRRLRTGARLIVGADVAWVVASIVTVLAGWYAAAGAVLVLVAAGVVGGFAFAEIRTTQALGRAQPADRRRPTGPSGPTGARR